MALSLGESIAAVALSSAVAPESAAALPLRALLRPRWIGTFSDESYLRRC